MPVPEYHNPRETVRKAMIEVLDRSFGQNGQKVPPDMVAMKADRIIDEYDRQINRHSWWTTIRDGLVVNFIWWLLVALVTFFGLYNSGKTIAIQDRHASEDRR